MQGYVADTHSLVWFMRDEPKLGTAARDAFQACDGREAFIYVPTICLVEIAFLQERGRIPAGTLDAVVAELAGEGSAYLPANLTVEIAQKLATIPREEVPELPDRIIAATAASFGLPLVTKDRRIRSSSVQTIW